MEVSKVSKAADRSSRMRTDDLESAFVICRASVTESSAVSVEWPLLKPDCLASILLFCERNNETWLRPKYQRDLALFLALLALSLLVCIWL